MTSPPGGHLRVTVNSNLPLRLLRMFGRLKVTVMMTVGRNFNLNTIRTDFADGAKNARTMSRPRISSFP